MSEITPQHDHWQTAKRDASVLLRVGYFLVAILTVLSILKWYGFSPWTISDTASMISSIHWAHTIPPVVLAIAIIFRPSLLELLARLRKVGFGDLFGEFDNSAPMRSYRSQLAVLLPRITVDDVRYQMKNIPYINVASIESDAENAHAWLLRNGINTIPLLCDFVAAREIHRILAEIYIDILGRDKERPLDANAIATWGATLFTFGPREDVIRQLRNQISESDEARTYRARNTE